jgi:predicted DNA-binding transcriptional regulator AlpA
MTHRPEVTGCGGPQKFLRLHAVLAFTGWSRSTLYDKILKGKFARPVKLDEDGRAVGWPESEVLAHQQARIAARDAVKANVAERTAIASEVS